MAGAVSITVTKVKRLLNVREASDYCGVPVEQLNVQPVTMPGGKKLYDVVDLNDRIEALKGAPGATDDDVLGRLGP